MLTERHFDLIRAGAWIAALIAVILFGAFVIDRCRRMLGPGEKNSGDLLSDFRELHDQGELSDEEYRTIKTKMAGRLRDEFDGRRKKTGKMERSG